MTDDERMDRARRIREMREGARPDDEAQGDDRDADDAEDGAEADSSVDADDGSADGDDAHDGAATDDDTATHDTADDENAVSAAEADDTTVFDDAATDTSAGGSQVEAEADGGPDAADADSGDGSADEPSESSTDEAAEAVANLDIDESAVGGAEAAGDAGDGGDDGGTIHIPGADVGDVDVDVEEMARQAGLSSAEGVDADAGDDDAELGIGATGAAGRAAAAEEDTGEETRVLEFSLGDEQYCLDIEYVEEIVKRETVTRVPNTPDCVEGVVDLRGQITTILDPKVLLDIDQTGSKDLIVVFDPDAFDDQGAVGWVVDDVNQVTPITEEEVNDSPVDQDHINGVVDRDGEFVIWTTPELDLDEVAG